jgi:tetratricopeptide (TPR) repeat protein
MSFWRHFFTLGGDEAYDQAMAHYNHCRYKEAITGFDKVIQMHRGKSRLHKELARFYKSQAYRNYGIIHMHEGRFGEAIVNFKMALEIIPESIILHSHLGVCYNNVGRFNHAIAEFEKVLDDKRSDIQSRIRLGLALRNQGLYNRAIDQFQAAININPGHADLHYFLGLVLCNKHNYREAVKELERALGINPHYTEARDKLRFINILVKEPPSSPQAAAAKDELFKAIVISLGLSPFISPDLSKKDIGLYNTLIYVYNQILKEHPNYADIYFKLAQIYENQEKFQEAEDVLKKALQINPDFIQARVSLGFIYKETSRLEEAAREFSYVIDSNLPYPIIAFNLGLVYKRLNRIKEATRAFEIALQLDPGFEEARAELKNLSGK